MITTNLNFNNKKRQRK